MAFKIYLYDNEFECIGQGCMSTSYVQYQLQEAQGQDVDVHISSVGGDAFQAVAIYNLLKIYSGTVTTYIDSVAASAAATIAMAGNEVVMSKYGALMIHKPATFTGGNADDLQSDVQMLDVLQQNIVSIYMDKTGLDQAKIESLVNATTWLNADEALALNFIDKIEDYVADTEIVKNAGVVLNYMTTTAPSKYKQVTNKLLVKPAPATIENKMTKQEIEAIVNPTNSLLKKVMNYFTGVNKKIATNKGDKFIVGNFIVGAPVFNDADMETSAEDEAGIIVTNADGKKQTMDIAGGKVSNLKDDDADGDTKEDDDDDLEADNKAVLNAHAINFKKSVGNKVLKNTIAKKLAEVTNRANQQDALIVELRSQLQVSNSAFEKHVDDIKADIRSEFEPNSSQRSNSGATNSALPSFMPKEGTVAANAVKKAVVNQKK